MITNPLFQADWQTAGADDPRGPGNQIPNGWTMIVTPQSALMPWPTKGAKSDTGTSITVESRAGGPGEYVHKLSTQLPDNEQLGQPRALLVLPNTNKIYKCFGNIPQAVQLRQVINEAAGTKKKYVLYVLAETANTPTLPNPDLEDDHWRVALSLGDTGAQSNYAGMKNVRTLPGNERAWNKIEVEVTFPSSGSLTLTITLQQNWSGATDFFVAGITEETLAAPPGTTPPVNDTPADKYERLEDRLIALSTIASLAGTDIEQLTLAIQNAQVELYRLRNG